MLVEYQATKGWSEYMTTQLARAGQNIQPMTQSGKVNYVILNQKDSYNHFSTYCQPVCYFLKNTTIPRKEYLQYPVNTTYNNLSDFF